jgi:hypothetical protein
MSSSDTEDQWPPNTTTTIDDDIDNDGDCPVCSGCCVDHWAEEALREKEAEGKSKSVYSQ